MVLKDNVCHHVGPAPCIPESELCNINTLEMWPVLVGIRRWGHHFSGKTVIVYVDNTQVMYMLTNTSSTNNVCLKWLKEIFWLCIEHDIQLEPRYISSNDNFLADALSRATGDKVIDVGRLEEETEHWCCAKLLLSFFNRWRRDIQMSTTPTRNFSSPSNEGL